MANDDAVRQAIEIPARRPRTTRNPASALPQPRQEPQPHPIAVPYSRSIGKHRGNVLRPPPVSLPYTRASPHFSFPGSVMARNESPNPCGDARAH